MTFEIFYNAFQTSSCWANMLATTEGTGWHRESSVACHTQMVLDVYRDTFSQHRSAAEIKIAQFALLFHDTGKFAAERKITSEDGAVRNSYPGHEQDSAVTFMECYVRNMHSIQSTLSVKEARAVRWIIEHHLPYDVKNEKKRQYLAVGTAGALGECDLTPRTFTDCLFSDSKGRISDNHDEKIKKVNDWIIEFNALSTSKIDCRAAPIMYLMIGPSGSGKSTFSANLSRHENVQRWSDDEFKMQYTQMTDYHAAWNFCADTENLTKFLKAREHAVRAMLGASRQDFIVDMVNGSRKMRLQWISLAREFGFHIRGVEFWNTLDTLSARQLSRPDKNIPADIVRMQQYSCTVASLGYEVDSVKTVIGK